MHIAMNIIFLEFVINTKHKIKSYFIVLICIMNKTIIVGTNFIISPNIGFTIEGKLILNEFNQL